MPPSSTGQALPLFGMGVDHTTFFVGDHSVGGVAATYLPLPSVRQPAVSDAQAEPATKASALKIESARSWVWEFSTLIYILSKKYAQRAVIVASGARLSNRVPQRGNIIPTD